MITRERLIEIMAELLIKGGLCDDVCCVFCKEAKRKLTESADKILAETKAVIEGIQAYTPAPFCRIKHMPTDTQRELQTLDVKSYQRALAGVKHSIDGEYDFRRGWEYGFGWGEQLFRNVLLEKMTGGEE